MPKYPNEMNEQRPQQMPQAPEQMPQRTTANGIPIDEGMAQQLRQLASNELNTLVESRKRKADAAQMRQKIGTDEVVKAAQILRKYKEGKAKLEQKIIHNEEFWKLRQWNYMSEKTKDFKPATAWLWSCIQSRYSDVMDSYPTCNIKPRQEDDIKEAQKLSSVVPVILEQNRYEEVYSDIAWYTLKHGGSVQGVFWDGSKHNGLGDINIKKIDFINLFWEPGITDIQKSTHLFNTELVSNDIIQQRYPQTIGKLGGQSITQAKYLYDDYVDTSDKSVVIDWYYHTEVNGRRVLQYCKFVNDIVLYASENDTEVPTQTTLDPYTGIPVEKPTGESIATRGFYDHGLYPFITMALYPVEGSICGYGLTDIGRDTQLTIDKLNKAITDNAIVGAKPRYFIRGDGSVNEEEYADTNNDFVHVSGNIGEENVRPIDVKPLPANCVEVLNQKIEELKYVTSNQDSNNGVAPSGITAASAIAALQEAAGKNARSSNKAFHRAFREVCYQVIELVRQFYDTQRTFRISPDGVEDIYINYDNSGLVPQPMQNFGVYAGLRLPEFDVDVTSEKANPYKKAEMNELALNFYAQGFFNPQMSDQAIAALQMMDFTQKDDIIKRIQQNGTMYTQLLQYQQLALTYASMIDPMQAEQIANNILQSNGQQEQLAQGGRPIDINPTEEEHPYVERARNEARSSTQAD